MANLQHRQRHPGTPVGERLRRYGEVRTSCGPVRFSPGVLRFYPAPIAILRLQELHRRSQGQQSGFALSISARANGAQARALFKGALQAALAHYAVMNAGERLRMFASVLAFAAQANSMDGIESLFLSGLASSAREQDRSMYKIGARLWRQIGPPRSLGGGAPTAPVYDAINQVIGFHSAAALNDLVSDGFGVPGPERGPLGSLGNNEDCVAVMKLGGAIGGAVLGGLGGALAGSAAAPSGYKSEGFVGGLTLGVFSGGSGGDAILGDVANVVCGGGSKNQNQSAQPGATAPGTTAPAAGSQPAPSTGTTTTSPTTDDDTPQAQSTADYQAGFSAGSQLAGGASPAAPAGTNTNSQDYGQGVLDGYYEATGQALVTWGGSTTSSGTGSTTGTGTGDSTGTGTGDSTGTGTGDSTGTGTGDSTGTGTGDSTGTGTGTGDSTGTGTGDSTGTGTGTGDSTGTGTGDSTGTGSGSSSASDSDDDDTGTGINDGGRSIGIAHYPSGSGLSSFVSDLGGGSYLLSGLPQSGSGTAAGTAGYLAGLTHGGGGGDPSELKFESDDSDSGLASAPKLPPRRGDPDDSL